MGHANARLTPHGRKLLVERVRVLGWSVADAARSMGVSRQCAHRWVRRFDTDGEVALVDRSSRPHTSPTRTPAVVEQVVLDARAAYQKGPDWLAVHLGMPARTISRILRRHDVAYLRDLDLVTGDVVRERPLKRTPIRYERDHPGELVHMDIKKVARIPNGGGWRLWGRQGSRTEAHKQVSSGYEYLHSVVDDHTRIAYSELLDDTKATTCVGFFERAIGYYQMLGITITGLMTDNAWEYRNSLALADLLRTLDAAHWFIRPYHPWQNGKVERYNRIIAEEWLYSHPWTTNQARADTLPAWLDHYNFDRPHGALRYHPPISRLSPT